MPSVIACVVVAAGLGAATEAIARLLRLWIYRSPVSPVLNVLLMFGLIQGGAIAGLVGSGQPLVGVAPVLVMTGALVGIAYEGLNHFRLRAWDWGEAPLMGLVRPIDKAAAVGASWGLVPLTTACVARLPILAGGHG